MKSKDMFRHLDFYNCDKKCGGGKILIFYIIIIILTFVCARENGFKDKFS